MFMDIFVTGTLLIFHGGSWKGLCDHRISDKSWNTKVASVCIKCNFFTFETLINKK